TRPGAHRSSPAWGTPVAPGPAPGPGHTRMIEAIGTRAARIAGARAPASAAPQLTSSPVTIAVTGRVGGPSGYSGPAARSAAGSTTAAITIATTAAATATIRDSRIMIRATSGLVAPNDRRRDSSSERSRSVANPMLRIPTLPTSRLSAAMARNTRWVVANWSAY